MNIVVFFFSSFACLLTEDGTNSETFEAFIFGCTVVRIVELATQVL